MAIYNKRPLIYIPKKKNIVQSSGPAPTPSTVEAICYADYQLKQYNGNNSSKKYLKTFSIDPETQNYHFTLQNKEITYFRKTASGYGYAVIVLYYENNNYTNTVFDQSANGYRWPYQGAIQFGYTCYGFFIPSGNNGPGGRKIFRFLNFTQNSGYRLPITADTYQVSDVQPNATYQWSINYLKCENDVIHILANKLIDKGLISATGSRTGVLMLISSKADNYTWREPQGPVTTYLNADFLGLANNIAGHNQFGQKNEIEDIVMT